MVHCLLSIENEKKLWFYEEKREYINEKLTDIIGNVLQLNCQNRSRKNVCGPWSK